MRLLSSLISNQLNAIPLEMIIGKAELGEEEVELLCLCFKKTANCFQIFSRSISKSFFYLSLQKYGHLDINLQRLEQGYSKATG